MLAITLLSCHEMVFDGPARHVILPGERGVFEVWPCHRPLVSRLLPGLIVVDERSFPIRRGMVKLTRDTVTALIEPEPVDES